MDAKLFFKEFNRMCEGYKACKDCPIKERKLFCEGIPWDDAGAVDIVEQWSKEHPTQTNRQKFEEVFGKEPTKLTVTYNGMLVAAIDAFADWWDAPYEAPKED